MTDIKSFTLKLDNGSVIAVTKRLHQLGASFSMLQAEPGLDFLRHDYTKPSPHIENFGLRLFGFIVQDIGSNNYEIVTDQGTIDKIGQPPITTYGDGAIVKILEFIPSSQQTTSNGLFSDCVRETKSGVILHKHLVAEKFLSLYKVITFADTEEIFYYDPLIGIYVPAEKFFATILQET